MDLSKLFCGGASDGSEASCAEILEVLQSYLDGETDTGVALEVSVHLGDCHHCEHESQVYERIKISLCNTRPDVDPAIIDALSHYGQRLARGDTASNEQL